MRSEFWLERWARNEIGFHLPVVNARLRACWPALDLAPGTPVLVPLCGKSLDLRWLAERGHPVTGVELSDRAVAAFFEAAGVSPAVTPSAHFTVQASGRVRILCGDFFDLHRDDLHRDDLGHNTTTDVTAVFDRAALVALPPEMRVRYAAHLQQLLPGAARILLVTLEYDQSRVPGPPHAVLEDEVRALFEPRGRIECLLRETVTSLSPSFRAAGIESADEVVYRIDLKPLPETQTDARSANGPVGAQR
ncbi:MAG: thiopurine S-methyltransferase [Gammaproteobacteria bacterium]